MSFTAEKKSKTTLPEIKKGNYPARILQLIDCGKQHIKGYNKKTKQWFPLFYLVDDAGNTVKNDEGYAKQVAEDTGHPVIRPKYMVQFELPTQTMEYKDEVVPRWIKKDLTFNQLIKLAQTLTNGVVEDLPGTACFVATDHTTGGYAKVMNVTEPVDGIDIAPLHGEAVLFDFDNPDQNMWSHIPVWIQDEVKEATNFSGSALEQMVSGQAALEANADHASESTDPVGGFDDDIPFAPLSFHG